MQLLCSELAALSQPFVGWLVGRLSALASRAPARLASPSRRERGECSAAEGHRRRRLRVRRRPAPPEPTGPRHRGRLSPATVRRSATVPSPGATHLAIWTSSMRSPLLYRSRRGATVPSALSVDNDSARSWTTTRCGGDDKHSQPNAELAKGRQVRMPCAPVELTPWMDLERHRGWRCSTRTAAMDPGCAYVYHLTQPVYSTVGGATTT